MKAELFETLTDIRCVMESENIDYEEICIRLIKCEGEDEVVKVLKDCFLWDDMNLWKSYGGVSNNWSTVNNQMGTAVGSLVELLVNSGDANLINKCRERGIDPTDWSECPRSIDQAVSDFFDISENKLYEMTGQQRSELAANTCGLVVTGSKNTPSFGVFDFGEGQMPESFDKTFLSLSQSNKQSIPFVQGKFNQGSTGVLSYCGKHGFKLIVSKRNPKLENGINSKWAFTFVRRVRPSEDRGTKNSEAFYLCPNDMMPSFEADGIPVIPGEYPNAYAKALTYGSYVKLFDFDIGPSLRAQAQLDLNYKLSALLPKPILPVRIFERRNGYRGHTYETTMSGLMVRLEDLEKLEGFPIGGQFITKLGNFSFKIYLLPEGTDKSKYSGDDGVIYTVNGQTHATLPRNFFRRKSVKLGYIANSLIVLLDCSSLSYESIEEMFQTSRDRIKKTEATKEVEQQLEQILSSSSLLKKLNNERRAEAIRQSVDDQDLTHSIFNKIIEISPALKEILVLGNKVRAPFAPSDSRETAPPELKKFPTFFLSSNPISKEQPKPCVIGSRSRFIFNTDAENDYLDRVSDPGKLTVSFVGLEELGLSHSITPNSGRWTFVLKIPESAVPIKLAEIQFKLDDISRTEPIIETVFVEIQPGVTTPNIPTKSPRLPLPQTPPEQPAINANLPELNEIYKSDWDRSGVNFDDRSGICLVENENGYDFFVNMDNKFLNVELKSASPADDLLLKTRFKVGLFCWRCLL